MGLASGLDTPERMAAINSCEATPAELQPRLGTPQAFVVVLRRMRNVPGSLCRGIFGLLKAPRSTAHKKGDGRMYTTVREIDLYDIVYILYIPEGNPCNLKKTRAQKF